MPLIYKVPGYLGNALLLVVGLIVAFSQMPVVGLFLIALSGLNLFLMYKLDRFSHEEVWLAHELQVTKLREELLLERQRVSELETSQAGPIAVPDTSR